MIGKLWRMLSGAAVYACVATLVAQVVAVGYLCASGKLDNRRVDQILLAARGDIRPLAQPREITPQADVDQEQPSYEDRERARQLQSRQVEMREQALKSGLERIRFEQHNLTRDKERYDALQGAFDQRLEAAAIQSSDDRPRECAHDLGEHQTQTGQRTDHGNDR